MAAFVRKKTAVESSINFIEVVFIFGIKIDSIQNFIDHSSGRNMKAIVEFFKERGYFRG